jgi:hypothetical protein
LPHLTGADGRANRLPETGKVKAQT